ncbi:MiaB/RimO family radical SAM methylthiotransferase, partial [bacterium]|nr:MiaB/RimO family radical SAM methylthiotransferase [bacterium]
ERYSEVLKNEMPQVDIVFGNRDQSKIIHALERARNSSSKPFVSTPRDYLTNWYENNIDNGSLPSAYLKVSEGCNNRCSYCAIPSIRGNLRSAPIDSLVSQAEFLINSGVKEITLIGQDTTAYGMDKDENKFPDLLRAISSIEADFWIRVLYSHPRHMIDANIEALATTPKVLPYLDMPIQHISGHILERMGRYVDGDDIRAIVAKLKDSIPGIALRTSVMVGFPGETESDFNELCEFLDEGHFIHGGVFAYSPEDGTPAVNFNDMIEQEVAVERKLFVDMIFDRLRQESNIELEGKTLKVLVEREGSRKEMFWGRTRFDAPEIDRIVRFRGKAEIGTFTDVHIIKGTGFNLLGVQK